MTAHNHANHNDTKQQPDDAVAMLTADHRQVRALFQQYAETSDPYLQQIIAEHIFAELTLHMLLEETVFYPVFAEQTDEEGKRLVREACRTISSSGTTLRRCKRWRRMRRLRPDSRR